MGRRYRKSIKLGPLRINLSGSGVGYSVGNKYYRVTKKANGGMRTTATLPGTGISDVKEYSKDQVEEAAKMAKQKKKKVPGIVGGAAALLVLIGAIAGGHDSTPQRSTAYHSEQTQTQTVRPSTSSNATTKTETKTETQTQAEEPTKTETPAAQPAQEPAKTETPAQEPAKTEQPAQEPAKQTERKVYRTKTGKRYHYDSHCNGGDYYEVTLSQAEDAGLTPCKKCAGG